VTKRVIAIEARGLTKAYRVFEHPSDRLKQMLWPGSRRFYREFLAVRGVDLEITRGETVGIVGRNGSGKSTLLRMLCGTIAPSAGTLAVHGRIAPILTLGAGFNPDFTGRENAIMNAAILGLSETTVRERLDSIAAFADIGTFFDQPVRSYSSGMHARLAFAVAIHADPDLLVVDEVLAVGDEAFNRKCFARIEEIKRNGATILFVSHSPGLVVELCDRALLMEAGERLLTSDPKTVIARYHRLLYASRASVDGVREEIRRLDRGEDERPAGPGRAARRAPAASETRHARYDPLLVPESTVEYTPQGARIRNPRILDARGDRVNVLAPGETYQYAYEVEFESDAFRVRFGMMIKLVTGFELGGQSSHPPRAAIEHVPARAVARVRFSFQTLLTPGVYFLNAGVLGIRDDEAGYLHRILDAAIFRVESANAADRITGTVDLATQRAPQIEIVASPAESATATSSNH
jgi:lipopolysaccharide transport system ATP-binding protein